MKVLVLWEDPNEQAEAENLAKVLGTLAPSLAANADVDDHGGVTIQYGDRPVPKVSVLAANWTMDSFHQHSLDHSMYVEALEHAVFKR